MKKQSGFYSFSVSIFFVIVQGNGFYFLSSVTFCVFVCDCQTNGFLDYFFYGIRLCTALVLLCEVSAIGSLSLIVAV